MITCRRGRWSPRGSLPVVCFVLFTTMVAFTNAHAVSNTIVISQVYGGGGNTGAPYHNDFIELFNRGSVAVDITGWTVQYASAAGTTWMTTALSGTIPAGGYYLIQEAPGAGGGAALPTPDATGTIAMSAASAKVALVNDATLLTGSCPTGASIVDFVGYGAANCSESFPAGMLSNTTAALRNFNGCEDTDNNSANFTVAAPAPRNSASPTQSCQHTLGVTLNPPEGGSVAKVPDQATYQHGTSVELTATPAVGWHFVNWTGGATGTTNPVTVVMDGSKTVTATFAINSYTLDVTVAGSGAVTKNPDQSTYDHGTSVELTAAPATGWQFVNWSGDASGSANPLTVVMDGNKAIVAHFRAPVVISQLYGGGGNTGAPYHNDFIELFNRGDIAVDVTGWTVQYAAATGATWSGTALSGTIPPGGYYLIQEAPGAGGGASLPTPDAVGTIAMNAVSAKVALVSDASTLTGSCPGAVSIMDLVGYGPANCSEGSPTGSISNVLAAHRKSGGCVETNDNSADFAVAPPAPRNSASPLHACQYTLDVTVDPLGGGSVARLPDQATYQHGTSVSLTATAASGYRFINWTGDAFGSANPLTVVMDGDKAIVAHFTANAPVGLVVISQVFGGGGNTGAPYRNDYVELFNRGNAPVDITGWSLQYASANGNAWETTTLVGTIPPASYYLVLEAAGTGGGASLPAPDAHGTISISAVTGKLLLVNTSVVVVGDCPSGPEVVDRLGYRLGYGVADCPEAAPIASLDNVTAAFRNRGGCQDTDNNAADFMIAPPSPRNSSSPFNYCPEWLGVGDTPVSEFALGPVVPNPTAGELRVELALPRQAALRLTVLDVQGREIATLAEGTFPPGRHPVVWNGLGSLGVARSGVYFIRLALPGRSWVRRVVFMQ